MRWFSWSGLVATILAVCVGGAFLAAMVAVAFQDFPITAEGAALLNTLGGALIGGLVSWLGRGVLDDHQDTTRRQDDTGSTPTGRNRPMTTDTPQPHTEPSDPGQPRDPATDPDRDLGAQPQDPDATQPQSPVTVANTDEDDEDEDRPAPRH